MCLWPTIPLQIAILFLRFWSTRVKVHVLYSIIIFLFHWSPLEWNARSTYLGSEVAKSISQNKLNFHTYSTLSVCTIKWHKFMYTQFNFSKIMMPPHLLLILFVRILSTKNTYLWPSPSPLSLCSKSIQAVHVTHGFVILRHGWFTAHKDGISSSFKI